MQDDFFSSKPKPTAKRKLKDPVELWVNVIKAPASRNAVQVLIEALGSPIWLPKSLCVWDGEGLQTITVEAWKWKQLGLQPGRTMEK